MIFSQSASGITDEDFYLLSNDHITSILRNHLNVLVAFLTVFNYEKGIITLEEFNAKKELSIEEMDIDIVQEEECEGKNQCDFKLVHKENSISPEFIDSERLESSNSPGYFCSNFISLNFLLFFQHIEYSFYNIYRCV